MTHKKKLIEVALPLEAINRASAHEKAVPRRGHPATFHLWWARRPLASARAVIFAQLIDNPSAHSAEFPTEDAYEEKRLHCFLDAAEPNPYTVSINTTTKSGESQAKYARQIGEIHG